MIISYIPHGHCYLWQNDLMLLHLLSDSLISIAYYSIPITLLYFINKRTDLPFISVFLMFATFIIACGTTHIIEIITLWYPIYWISGLIKSITAIVSIYTAIELFNLVPKALSLLSPAQLENINQNLELEILQRKKIAEELTSSRELYKGIVEDQTELIARFCNGIVSFVNQAYCRYFKVNHDQIIGKVYEPFIFPEDRIKVQNLLDSITPEFPVGKVQHRVIVQNQLRWMEWTNRGFFDRDGNLLQFQSVGRDITEQKLAELALSESESILNSFYNNVPLMMGVVELLDDDILYISGNLATCDFLGIPPEDINYQLISELKITSYYIKLWKKYLQECQTTNNPVHFEYIYQKNSEYRYLSVIFSPIRKTLNQYPRFCYVIEDITDRQITEIELCWKEELLQQMQEAQTKLQISLQEKEILLQEIHHRVKNNLQVICSLLSLQSNSIKDPVMLNIFEESQNRIISMAMIHDKLYQSHNLSQISFSEYINELVQYLFRCYMVDNNPICFDLDVSPKIYLNVEVAIPCGLIINELVSNSLKYAFTGTTGGKITIKLNRINNDKYLLIIKDNGIGIPPDINLKNPKNLGLQLVTNLIKQLKSSIELIREVGTEYRIYLSSFQIQENNL